MALTAEPAEEVQLLRSAIEEEEDQEALRLRPAAGARGQLQLAQQLKRRTAAIVLSAMGLAAGAAVVWTAPALGMGAAPLRADGPGARAMGAAEIPASDVFDEVPASFPVPAAKEAGKAPAKEASAAKAPNVSEAAEKPKEAAEKPKADAQKAEKTKETAEKPDKPKESMEAEPPKAAADEEANELEVLVAHEEFAGRTSESLAKREEEENDGCAEAGASCLKSKCCKEPGTQCYTKDAWWGQCMEKCNPGPNVLDQSTPTPWKCEALGERTPGTPKKCSAEGEDCRTTQCCSTPGTQCFRKNEFWATCRAECTAGPNLMEDDFHPWSCEALGPRTPGAAPWVRDQCAKDGENCAPKGCCAEPGYQCYTQTQWYSKCKPSCTPGEKENAWTPAWECKEVGMRTPSRFEGTAVEKGIVKKWVVDRCSKVGENCLETQCCHAVNQQCYTKSEYWGNCREDCSTDPDLYDGNATWECKTKGPRSWGLAIKGYPSLYCFSLFMPQGYEGPLLKAHLDQDAGIFSCDGYDIFANMAHTLGTSKDGIEVSAILIPKIDVGVSQDGTAGNAKLFMAVWDKVIASNRFRDYDFTLKVDPDAVLLPWRIRDHMRPHIGSNAYVVNCNKFPNSPNFPMMFGAVEIFSMHAMISYAMGSWKCGQQLPWGSWGEDYYMTHCLDYLGVGRIADFGVLGDSVCTGANCADPYKASFHPFKTVDSWNGCWWQATKKS